MSPPEVSPPEASPPDQASPRSDAGATQAAPSGAQAGGERIDAPPAADAVVLSPPRTSRTLNGVSVTVHRFVNPPRTGDSKSDYWTQFQAWGELKNESSQMFRTISARVYWFDAAGKIIDSESIASAAQQDVGDLSEGESVYGEVEYVAPGETTPFHLMRNLDAIKGQVAGFVVVPRMGTDAGDQPPRGSLASLSDAQDAGGGEMSVPQRRITGRFTNEGRGRCRDPRVVYAFLDDRGLIREIRDFSVGDNFEFMLEPGQSHDFTGSFGFIGDTQWKAQAKLRFYASCREALE